MNADIAVPLVFRGRTVHVHGTAAQVEFTDEGDASRWFGYRGWGTVVQAQVQRVWVHVSFPVDVDWTSNRLTGERREGLGRLAQVGAFWDAGSVSSVMADLWDGRDHVAHADHDVSGPMGFAANQSLMLWEVDHTVRQSLGLSMGLLFPMNVDSAQDVPNAAFTLFSAFAVFD